MKYLRIDSHFTQLKSSGKATEAAPNDDGLAHQGMSGRRSGHGGTGKRQLQIASANVETLRKAERKHQRERERGLRSCAYDEYPGGERKRKKKRMLNCEQQLQKAKVGGNHLHASTVPKANEDNHRFNSFRQTISYPYELLDETLPVTGLPGREESPLIIQDIFIHLHPSTRWKDGSTCDIQK